MNQPHIIPFSSWVRLVALGLLLGFGLFTGNLLTSSPAHAQQLSTLHVQPPGTNHAKPHVVGHAKPHVVGHAKPHVTGHAKPLSTVTVTSCADDTQLQSDISSATSGETINFSCSGDIKLTQSLNITTSLTLDGSGQSVTLDGANSMGVLIINGVSSFTLNALTVANGNGNGTGGGLYNDQSTVYISNSTITNNVAAEGAGLFNYLGTVNISNSTFASNDATAEGAGLFNEQGTVNISNSTFANNSTVTVSPGGPGGGFSNEQGTVNISNSTFSGNAAGNGGGSFYTNGGTVSSFGSILSDNGSVNCYGGLTDQGYNLSNDTTCGLTASTSQQNINPQVASALANNGGPTQTLALVNGSPAIDQIPVAQCPITDQRGITRPDDSETTCDIGAYESNYVTTPPTTITITNCASDTQLQNAISSAFSGYTINFACSGDIKLTHTLTIGTTNLTLDGSGQSVTLDGNDSVQVLAVNYGVTFTLNDLTIAHGLAPERSGDYGYGGGLLNSGTANINSSTFTNNSALQGGAIYNGPPPRDSGTVNISNSTIANNSVSSGGSGGGLFNNATVNIINSTFADNSSDGGGSGIFTSGTVNSFGSIVANNAFGNCIGSITDQGYNMSNDTSCGFSASTSQQNSNPQLASALASNGGPTQTLALLTGSPAIDQIPAAQCLQSDQRGITRPDDSETTCDIGAYESNIDDNLGLSGLPANITTNATSGKGAVVTYTAPTATDESGDNPGPSVACTPASGSTFAIGTTKVTCTATDSDDSNSPVNQSFTVTVNDTDLSLSGLPATITVNSPDGQGVAVTYTAPTATDEDNNLPPVNCVPASGSTFPIGTTKVSCTTTDSDDLNSPVTGSFLVNVSISSITDCSDDTELQSAISNAASGQTITFNCSGDIKLSKTLTIATNLTLDGSGQTVTLDGNNSVEVLHVNSGVSFTLKTLTVANGNAKSSGYPNYGGGLFSNGGTVSISDSTFTNNTATQGGGLYTQSGSVSISNSTFTANSTPTNSGGGLFSFGGTLNISNSTFTTNSAVSGGGFFTQNDTVNISSSTFAANTASYGGGISNDGSGVNISSSIMANSIGGNCYNNGLTDQGYNLASDSSCDLTTKTSQQNIDPQLASALASNGGPTQTLALLNGSPAIDQIPTAQCPKTDQRGTSRPDDSETTCDIGAYESNYPPDTDLGLTGMPPNITADATSSQGAVVTYTDPTATDESGDNPGPSVACTPASGSTFAIGTTTVTCTASDSDDTPGTVSQSFQVMVQDKLPPTLQLPSSPITVNATGAQGAVVTYTVTATDPVYPSSQLTIICTPASGSTFAIGTTTVNCTVTDPANNSASGSFQVVVNGAATQLSNLITTVNSFHFTKGIQTSLDVELKVAQNAINHGNTKLACGSLSLFVLEVTKLNGHGITVSQASQLLASAKQIQGVIGC